MKILVTGATGYAGFYAAIALRQAGHQVYGLTRDENKLRARDLQQHEVRLAVGDVSQPESYRQFLNDSDAIVHAMMDFKDPQGTDLTLFDTLQQIAQSSPINRCFVYTTGCSIYGKRSERVMDETTPANPDHKLAFRMDLEQKLFATSIPYCHVEVINQFGMAIDLRDWDRFRLLFADSVEFDYSSIGEVAATLTPDEIANTAKI